MAASKGTEEVEEHPGMATDDEEDDEEVLEESPCGRWQKRREEVQQRDVPGIDCAFLAMDTEEGVEVVWNEVYISEKKSSKTQLSFTLNTQDKIKQVFDNLIQLDHANIVKFHKYWTDTKSGKPRVIFITEYMSSGSLKQFLKKTKKNNKTLKSWKRWCTQILSALSYLHSCDPPIIHGNLTCDTIFIQHNGLIKIGSVAPDAIYHHVKTYRKEEARNFHYVAPECASSAPVTTAVDIYSFGICALEMAVLGIPGNGDTGLHISEECIQKTLESLEDKMQKNFIKQCLEPDRGKRPSARDLLFHTVLFEVHSLKLLAAHSFVKNSNNLPENVVDNYRARMDSQAVVAELQREDNKEPVQFRATQAPKFELEKFLEDVRNGIYPLTAFALTQPPQGRQRPNTPEVAESVKSESPEPTDTEMRMVVDSQCQIKFSQEGPNLQLTILLRMDDRMNRQLSCEFTEADSAEGLADELVHYGFINATDRDRIAGLIEDHLHNRNNQMSPPAAQLIQANA